MTPQRRDLLELIHAYKTVFASEPGRAVLGDLIKVFGFTRKSTLVEGLPDKTAWNEGARCVIMHIGRYVDVNPATLPEEFSHAQFEALDDTPA